MTGQKVVPRRNRKAITVARTRVVGKIEVLPDSRVAIQFTQHVVELPKWAIRLITTLVMLFVTGVGGSIWYEAADTTNCDIAEVSN